MSDAAITMPDMHSIIRIPPETGMAKLRNMFPKGEADALNFVMFSTSGVHGSYTTIEQIEDEFVNSDAEAAHLTVLIVQPRTVSLHYGNILVTADDLPFLRTLRATSARIMAEWNLP